MPLLDAPLGEISKQLDLNVLSILRVTQGSVQLLRSSQSTNGALLVNNTSLVSTVPVPIQGAYSASKAAAGSVTECLRLELQIVDIQVIDLKTAVVTSAFFDNVPSVHLPSGSLYLKQKDIIEKRLKDGPDRDTMTALAWAEQIVRDLSHSKPSPITYRGGGAFLGRITSALPVGLTFKDKPIKNFSALKEIEDAYRKSADKANKS